MPTIAAHGVEVTTPVGWSARIYRTFDEKEQVAESGATVHLGNFPIPVDDGGFAAGMMTTLGSDQVGVAILEYLPGNELQPNVGLYEEALRPLQLTLLSFSPDALQVTIDGQLGRQFFFTVRGGRLFVYYLVLGSQAAVLSVPTLNQTLNQIRYASSVTGTDYA
jgi:hypothetical protein